MSGWLDLLNENPIPWLLEESDPAVRHLALQQLLDRPKDDPEVRQARAAAMESRPIVDILAAQSPLGYWVKPGPGYSPKYRGTVWQVIFLDQLGADGNDGRVRAACEYVSSHCQTEAGGFGASGEERETAPPPSRALHCLNGNLLRALIGFGWLMDERVQRAVDWQAYAVTGGGMVKYFAAGTNAPGFCCAANDKLPCAWGAVKALLALARIPSSSRPIHVEEAIRRGADLLLSVDPATANYPAPRRSSRPSESWFKLGFPSGYVADVLQNLEALCELGFAGDPRLQPAIRWLLSKQDKQGRWKNQYAYNDKTWVDIEQQGQPSKWVTLRACRTLKAVFE